MLSDAPGPEDLPSTPDEPYAAVPGPLQPSPPSGAESTGQPPPPSGLDRVGRRGTRVVAAVVVVALLVLVGFVAWGAVRPGTSPTAGPGVGTAASPSPAPSASGPSAAPRSTDHPADLAAYYTQPVDWRPCPGSPAHQCARVEVPVDYGSPDGDTFNLALRKVPALEPAKRVGSLLINPGGPGVSGLEYAQYSSFLFSKQVREAYDIVGFDPRGVGESDAVACLADDDLDLLFENDPTPDDAAERDKLLTDGAKLTERCAAAGGERALHMGTTEVARDLDVLRALVGDARLNYVGVSYGTLLGALYADLFPAHVGRMVLDSAVSPNQTDAQKYQHDVEGFEASIGAFAQWCAARDDCALGRDAGQAEDRILGLLDQVEQRPLRISKADLDSIGEGWVGFAIFMGLYSDTLWPTLNRGLAEAFQGRGDTLLDQAMAIVGRDASGDYDAGTYLQAMIPVRCADWPRSDPGALGAIQRREQAQHPLWARLNGELYDNCGTWPGAVRQPTGKTLGTGAAPILVIGNLRDPATPIGGTKQLAQDLDSGILVTSDHDGHGTYYAGNPCVDSIVDGYLLKGTVPSSERAC